MFPVDEGVVRCQGVHEGRGLEVKVGYASWAPTDCWGRMIADSSSHDGMGQSDLGSVNHHHLLHRQVFHAVPLEIGQLVQCDAVLLPDSRGRCLDELAMALLGHVVAHASKDELVDAGFGGE